MFVLINTLFMFILNKQVKAEVLKQPFKCVPSEKKLKSRENPSKTTTKEFFFGRIAACWPANLQKVSFSSDILQ